MRLDQLTVPQSAERGRWFDFNHPAVRPAPGEPPVQLLIASADVEAYQIDLENRLKAFTNRRLKGRRGSVQVASAEEQREAQIKAMAAHVLLDFRHIEGPDGPLDGDNPAHRELVLDSPYIREFVLERAEDTAAFLEAERGN